MHKRFLVAGLIVCIVGGGLIFDADKAFSYDPKTHDPLARKIAEYYNSWYDPDLTPEEVDLIAAGAKDEDTFGRWFNHFYDPVYQRGIYGNPTSRDWAKDQERQAVFPAGDRTWQRALAEYASGNKKEAYYTLGFIIHLIEDATVPAHTRNDDHGGKEIAGQRIRDYDPYEDWAKNNFSDAFFSDILSKQIKPKELPSLDNYFNQVAAYTNAFFFSKDTILTEEYTNPRIISEEDTLWGGDPWRVGYGIDEAQRKFRLVFISKSLSPSGPKQYSLDNPNLNLDYWNRLAPEAVINGAGVINLFHQNAEQAKAGRIAAKGPFTIWDTLSGLAETAFSKIIYHIAGGVIGSFLTSNDNALQEKNFDLRLFLLDKVTVERTPSGTEYPPEQEFPIDRLNNAYERIVVPLLEEPDLTKKEQPPQEQPQSVSVDSDNDDSQDAEYEKQLALKKETSAAPQAQEKRTNQNEAEQGDATKNNSSQNTKSSPDVQSTQNSETSQNTQSIQDQNSSSRAINQANSSPGAKTDTDLPNVLISEIAAGWNDGSNEFVEIYNPNDRPINLSNDNFQLQLVSSDGKITKKRVTWIKNSLPAKSYFLFAAGELASEGSEINPDASFSDQLTDISGVIIADGEGNIKDKVSWGKSFDPTQDKPDQQPPREAIESAGVILDSGLKTNQSLARATSSSGDLIDTDSNARDFRLALNPGPANSQGQTKYFDTIAPETILSQNNLPQRPTTLAEANFSFESTETGSNFECLLDSSSWAFCVSPKIYGNLPIGAHQFQVRAIDKAGNIDQTPVAYNWIIQQQQQEGQGGEQQPPPPSPPQPLPKILISEVQLGQGEFVELFNSESSTANLDGWYFSYFSENRDWNNPYRNKPFPAGVSISPLGYFLIGLAEYPQTGGNPNADWQPYTSAQLSDSSGAVAIFPWDLAAKTSDEAKNGRIDALGWGNAMVKEKQTVAASGAGQSLGRKKDSQNFIDGDNNYADFQIQTSPSPRNSKGETWQPQQQEQSPLDETPPDTILVTDSLPSALSSTASATFTFNSTEQNSAFQCLLDGQLWQSCFSQKEYAGLADGIHAFKVRAIDSSGNIDQTPAQYQWSIDTQVPVINLALGSDYLITKTSFTINWSSPSGDAASFDIEYKIGPSGGWELWETVNTSNPGQKLFNASQDATVYYFRGRAKDAAGNQSDWQTIQAEVNTKPVVINEIAWAGAKAEPTDEWIEFFSRAKTDINLHGWKLISSDGSPNIVFDQNSSNMKNPAISSGGFYLLERITGSETIANESIQGVSADWIGLFGAGLSNTSCEVLDLYDSQGNLIDETPCNGANWPAGGTPDYKSMERINSGQPGNQASNWASNDGIVRNGQDIGGNLINGTPKFQNSQKATILSSVVISQDTVWTKENGPYKIFGQDPVLEQGATLTIEPGAKIIFFSSQSFNVNGTLKSVGSSDEPIIFTDDLQIPGGWQKIKFLQSRGSIIENTIFEYGGSPYNSGGDPSKSGMLYFNNSSAIIKNSKFRNSKNEGIYSQNSQVDISGSEFTNNGGTGAMLEGGSANIANSSFIYNKSGIFIIGGGHQITGNTIKNSAQGAIYMNAGAQTVFDGNSVSGNSMNGIYIKPETISQDATWYGNLPYVVYSVSLYGPVNVASGATLTLNPGTVIKTASDGFNTYTILTINGDLKSQGTEAQPVVFTSIRDDNYGGDTNNDGGTSIPQSGDWRNIKILGNQTYPMECTIFRFGGGVAQEAMLTVENSALSITNSRFEKSANEGVYLKNSQVQISGSQFLSNGEKGLVIENNAVTVADSLFSGNKSGIYITDGSHAIKNNTIQNNQFGAIYINAAANNLSTIDSNTLVGNGTNNIVVMP